MKLYTPILNDTVIGIVESQISSEYYRVNINGIESAIISNLEFKNAVKRNKQVLEIGDAIYAKVIETQPDPLLSCKETLGLFQDGMIVQVQCLFSKSFSLYKPTLSKHFKFKSYSSPNGYIQFDTGEVASNYLVYQLIRQGQYMNVNQFDDFVSSKMQ